MITNSFSKKFGYILILSLTLYIFLGSSGAQAATTEELRQTIDRKNEEIKKLEELAKKYRDEVTAKSQVSKTLKNELARIDKTIKHLQSDIAVTEKKLQRTELEISKTKIEITAKESSINKIKKGLEEMIQYFDKNDGGLLLQMALYKNSLVSMLGQIDYSRQLQARMLESLETLKEVKNELKIKKAEAEEKKEELEELEKNLDARKKITENVKQEQKNLLAITKNQEEKYQKLLKETEEKQENILKETEKLEEELRHLINPDSLPKALKGVLQKPAEGIMSQGYGETPFAKKHRDFYRFHNGIDLAAPVGTKVVAAEDGIILGTGDTDKYCPKILQGKYIVINHDNNLATMYGHLSFIGVSSGQKVKRGDVIGYVGATGLATGPHLHFTVYDAKTVQIKKGPTGTCGPLPYGGSVNPLQYL